MGHNYKKNFELTFGVVPFIIKFKVKMSSLAHKSMDAGGMCYTGCQEAFEWFNSSVHWCQKGCDIGMGRQ